MSSKKEAKEWIKTSNLCVVLVKNISNEIMDNHYKDKSMFYRIAIKIIGEDDITYLDSLTFIELNEKNGLNVLDEETALYEDQYISKDDLIICQNNVTNLYDPMINTFLARKRKKH